MKTTTIVCTSLFLLNLFGLVRYSFLTLPVLLSFVILFIYNAWFCRKGKYPFVISFSLILIGLVCNVVSSYVYENTNPIKVISAYQFILGIFYLFFLWENKTSPLKAEKALVYLAIIMCSFYLLQFIAYQYGISFIERSKDYDFDAGTDVRLRMNGSALSAFIYFYGLGRYLKTQKFVYLLYLLLGASVIMLMSFRTMTIAIILSTIVFSILQKNSRNKLFLLYILLSIVIIIAYNAPFIQRKVDFMIEKQVEGEQTFDNDEYSRVLSFHYYTHEHFKDRTEYFFGSGLENGDTKYRKKIQALLSVHWSYTDWGLLGLSWMVGAITVMGILFYVFSVFKSNLSEKYIYIKAFYFYLILCSITTYEFAREGNFVVQALILYIVACTNIPKRSVKKNERLSIKTNC